MRTQVVALNHRVSSEVVAPAEGKTGDRLEEEFEFSALKGLAKLQIRKSVRTHLELRRGGDQFPKPEETISLVGEQPLFLLRGTLDRIQAVFGLERSFIHQESIQPVGHLRDQKILDDHEPRRM